MEHTIALSHALKHDTHPGKYVFLMSTGHDILYSELTGLRGDTDTLRKLRKNTMSRSGGGRDPLSYFV